MQTLRLCLSESFFFKAGCKLVGWTRMAFPWFCSCQDDCSINYVYAVIGRNLAQKNTLWETPVMIASFFPKVLKNAHCT